MAGAILHLFGPESMGGVGYFGARIDAETACTGLSDEEIGQKVYNSISCLYSGARRKAQKLLDDLASEFN